MCLRPNPAAWRYMAFNLLLQRLEPGLLKVVQKLCLRMFSIVVSLSVDAADLFVVTLLLGSA